MFKFSKKIIYGQKKQKENYCYRKVILTKQVFEKIERGKILSQIQWRGIGIQGSRGWQHYKYDPSYLNILIFRKSVNKNLNDLQIFDIINRVIESDHNDTILFRRESDQIITERVFIGISHENKEQVEIEQQVNQQNLKQNEQSFDVPEIKLFGRESSCSSNKTIKSFNANLQESCLTRTRSNVSNGQQMKFNFQSQLEIDSYKCQSLAKKQQRLDLFCNKQTKRVISNKDIEKKVFRSIERGYNKSTSKPHTFQFKQKISQDYSEVKERKQVISLTEMLIKLQNKC